MKRKLLKCTGTLTLALALAALSATPALAAETGTDAVTGLLSDILVALIGAGSVIAAACIGIRGAREIVKEQYAYFTSFSSKGHDLGRLLRQAKKEITIVANYGGNMLKKYKTLLEDCASRGIQINYLMLDAKAVVDMSYVLFGDAKSQTKRNVKDVLDRLKNLNMSANVTLKACSFPLPASYIAIDCSIGSIQKPKETAKIQVMLYQYRVPTGKAPITYMTKDGDAAAFKHTVASIKYMWHHATSFTPDSYFSDLEKKVPASRLSKAIQRLRKKIKHFFKKSVAHSALRCFLL